MNAVAASLLVITLTTQGHWFGGRDAAVELHWTRADAPVAAVVHWRLTHGPIELARGRINAPGADEPARLTLEPPSVRARTTLLWSYELRHAEDDRLLERGRRVVHLHPDDMLERLHDLGGPDLIVVAADDDALLALLREAGAAHEHVTRIESLRLGDVKRVVVAPGMLDARRGDEPALRSLARRGARVLVLEQQAVGRIAGLTLRSRSALPALRWRMDHPLLAGLERDDVTAWLARHDEVRALELPADEPALELAYWPDETDNAPPGPVDALLVTRRVGDGRVVLAQLPALAVDRDPRAQRLLVNALDHLAAPVGPTPSRAQRHAAEQRKLKMSQPGVRP